MTVALVGPFNQKKALVGAFSVIVQPVVKPMGRFAALNRIAGGEKAGLDEFPWVVSLHSLTTKVMGMPHFFCTGALLDPSHVLTAAHCVGDRDADDIMVILANNNKMSPHPQHVAVNVTRTYLHLATKCTSLLVALHICLRSRPIYPNVVCRLVS